MRMEEKRKISIEKEVEKLTKSLERYKSILSKKVVKCKNLNCDWTREEMFDQREKNQMSNDQWSAYFDKAISEENVKATNEILENALKRLERAVVEFEKVDLNSKIEKEIDEKELQWLSIREKQEDEYYEWLKQFRIDCLKDGIFVDQVDSNFMNGSLLNGKNFCLYINNGMTERSLHSYTLRINGITYFTSGLFSTCYKYLRNK